MLHCSSFAGDSVKKREREMGEAPSAVAAALEGAKGMANYFLGATPEGQDHFAFTPADGRVPELRMAVSLAYAHGSHRYVWIPCK